MQAQAVQQLGLVGRQGGGQLGHLLCLGVCAGIGLGRHLQHRHALQHARHFFQCRRRAVAIQAQRIHRGHHRGPVGLRQRAYQREHVAAVHGAQHLAHGGFLQLAAAKGNGLVGQAQRVAHGAARGAGQQAQRHGLGSHAFRRQHLSQVGQHGIGWHGAQVELQATAQHRDRHLLRVGGGQHELQVLGWLLQRLQHGVEGGVGEHVHFVDHEDLEAPLHRLVHRLLQQGLHLVHAPVRCGVELGVVHKAAGIDIGAGRAHAARRGGDAARAVRPGAVQGLGQNARDRGLAHTARAGEQVGVVQPLRGQRIAQGLHHVFLPHHLGEVARTVLAGQDDIGHEWILSVAYNEK